MVFRHVFIGENRIFAKKESFLHISFVMKRSPQIILLLIIIMYIIPVSAKRTPVMGWSSWNTYRVNISDSLILRQAEALVGLGLDTVGYRYVNIDDGYFGGRDLASGKLKFHPVRFPAGLKPVVDGIHALGLKAGIYSDAGRSTCGSFWDNDTIALNVGLYGHESRDCGLFFKDLGFDFIKIDFCGGDAKQNGEHLSLDPRKQYGIIRDAVRAAGRNDVTVNACRWDYPGTWVGDVADSWRISHDISPSWASVRNIIAQNLYLSAYCDERGYNDMDMLEVGRGMSPEEDRTHFGMWCMMSSPLLIGCDLTTLKPETLQLLKNRELIALNQDTLGLQAYVAVRDGDSYILVKDVVTLEGNKRAVAFYNPSDGAKIMTLSFRDVQLGGKVRMRDLFAQKPVGSEKDPFFLDSFTVAVPPHGLRINLAEADRRLEREVYEAETAFLTDYQEIYNALATGTPVLLQDSACSGGIKVANLGYSPTNDIVWRNVRSEKGGEYNVSLRLKSTAGGKMYLKVNDGPGVTVEYPGSEEWESVSVPVVLRSGGNTVRLYDDHSAMPEIDFMEVGRRVSQ